LDLLSGGYGGMWSGNIDFPELILKAYSDWVFNIAEQGFTQAVMAKYSTMLGYFNQYSYGYGGYLLESLDTPLAILQAQSGCY